MTIIVMPANRNVALTLLDKNTGGTEHVLLPVFRVYCPAMTPISPELLRRNIEKSFALASALFPGEEWFMKGSNIWVARSRLPEEYRETEKWEREMSQVLILTGRGSVAYFLPEQEKKGETGTMCADLVLDGEKEFGVVFFEGSLNNPD
ncbi:MAG: hypothetical protein LBK83_12635 [Treponema sp.]|jgi:hypothetical protein|nr:hypothetical protein [Treponema sp.]